MKFTTTLELHGQSATGIVVPPAVVEALGAGKRPAVKVSFRGYSYRSTIASMGGQFLVGVSAEHRAASGVAAGDVLDVDIELDTAPREVEVPADLAAALDADPAVRAAFDLQAPSIRKEAVRSVEEAKAAATRERRIAKAVDAARARLG